MITPIETLYTYNHQLFKEQAEKFLKTLSIGIEEKTSYERFYSNNKILSDISTSNTSFIVVENITNRGIQSMLGSSKAIMEYDLTTVAGVSSITFNNQYTYDNLVSTAQELIYLRQLLLCIKLIKQDIALAKKSYKNQYGNIRLDEIEDFLKNNFFYDKYSIEDREKIISILKEKKLNKFYEIVFNRQSTATMTSDQFDDLLEEQQRVLNASTYKEQNTRFINLIDKYYYEIKSKFFENEASSNNLQESFGFANNISIKFLNEIIAKELEVLPNRIDPSQLLEKLSHTTHDEQYILNETHYKNAMQFLMDSDLLVYRNYLNLKELNKDLYIISIIHEMFKGKDIKTSMERAIQKVKFMSHSQNDDIDLALTISVLQYINENLAGSELNKKKIKDIINTNFLSDSKKIINQFITIKHFNPFNISEILKLINKNTINDWYYLVKSYLGKAHNIHKEDIFRVCELIFPGIDYKTSISCVNSICSSSYKGYELLLNIDSEKRYILNGLLQNHRFGNRPALINSITLFNRYPLNDSEISSNYYKSLEEAFLARSNYLTGDFLNVKKNQTIDFLRKIFRDNQIISIFQLSDRHIYYLCRKIGIKYKNDDEYMPLENVIPELHLIFNLTFQLKESPELNDFKAMRRLLKILYKNKIFKRSFYKNIFAEDEPITLNVIIKKLQNQGFDISENHYQELISILNSTNMASSYTRFKSLLFTPSKYIYKLNNKNLLKFHTSNKTSR